MRFLHPLWLLSAVPVGLIALWLVRARGTGRRPWAVVLRCLSLALIVLALAQPQVGSGSAGKTVLALDRSLSVEAGESEVERAWLKASQSEGCPHGCPVVQFAGVPELTKPSDGLLVIRPGGALDGERTDLQSALALALARAPAGGQVVLLSDGQQTAGEVSAVAAEARARDVRIDVVPLVDQRLDVALTRLQAPRALHAGDPFSLQFTVQSTLATEVEITLKRDGTPAAKPLKLAVEAGENPRALERLTAPSTPGSYSYELSVSVPGLKTSSTALARENNTLATTVQVEREPDVVVAGSAGSEASRLAGMLEGNGIKTAVVEPQTLPSSASEYSAGEYGEQDAVVLSDVSASELGSARAQALSEAVQAGRVGLLVLGGPNSFSVGRYYESPLQTLLPVRSLVPGTVKGAIALELVLDHSYSMTDEVGEYAKIEMAQTASRVAAKALTKHHDELGLVAFNVKPRTIVPLKTVTKGAYLTHTDKLIDSLQPEGGTDIGKGLESGAKQVEQSKAPDRHIVLMTDGFTEGAEDYKKLLPKLHKDHITVSTIALGDEADTKLLKAIAHETGGEYFRVDEAGELPKIFSKQTRLSARPVRLEGTIGVRPGEPSPVLESLEGETLPPLHGNVATALKEGAQTDLLSEDPHGEYKADPALAQWQYGIGRVLTWTPGISEGWAGAWAGKAALWQDAVRWVERGATLPTLTPVLAAGDQEELELDTVRNDGVEVDYEHLSGELDKAGEPPHPLHFTQTAPSRYIAALPPVAPGVYEYTISDGHESAPGRLESAHGRLALPYAAEYRPAQGEENALGPLVAETGGQVLAANGEASIRSSWSALWPWLALAALLCFLADVALRMLGGGPRSRDPRLRAPRARPGAPTQTADPELARS